MRLIDANALVEHLARCIEQSKGLMRYVCVAIKCFVEQMPTVDAVEVVRCKDCKYCNSDTQGLWCFRDYENDLKPDDFCSNGERRTADA